MDNKVRVYIYAFLSRIFSSEIDLKLLNDIKNNRELLETIGKDSYDYFHNNSEEDLLNFLSIDYCSTFIMNNNPIESSVLDVKNEILIGLQNPVMQFYVDYGYDLNLTSSSLNVPDHIGLEFGFMQNLAYKESKKVEYKFMTQHILTWIPPFLISIQEITSTPFYKDICNFTIEFLLEDYKGLMEFSDDGEKL